MLALAKPGKRELEGGTQKLRSECKERHKPIRIVSRRLKSLQRGALPIMTRAIRKPIGSHSEQEDGLVPQPSQCY